MATTKTTSKEPSKNPETGMWEAGVAGLKGMTPQDLAALSTLITNTSGLQTPSPFSALSPERLQAAINQMRNSFLPGQEALFATPSMVGGVGVTQATEVSPQQQKKQAFIQFRMSQGDTMEEATKKANKVVADPNVSFGDKKKFVNAVRQGQFSGLSTDKEGKIKAAPKFEGGGVQTPGVSEAINNALRGLALQSANAAYGLPQAFAGDIMQSMGFRQAGRNQLASIIGEQGSEGLSANELADVDALLKARQQQLSDMNRRNLQSTVGQMESLGFTNSSLMPQALQNQVFDAQDRFLTNLAPELASYEQALLNNRLNRKTQGLGNIINAMGSAGNPFTMSTVLEGIQNPSNAGLFNDVTAANMANTIQQQNITNRQTNQANLSELMTKPVTIMPDTSGGFSMGGALGGALGGAKLGSMFGPVGAGIGGLAGGLFGGFK